MSEFVDHDLDGMRCMGMPHGTPPQGRDRRRRIAPIDLQGGDRIRHIDNAFDRGYIDAVFDQVGLERRSEDERLPDETMAPRQELSRGVEPCADGMVEHGTIPTARDVVFARPDEQSTYFLFQALPGDIRWQFTETLESDFAIQNRGNSALYRQLLCRKGVTGIV
jgi:hypothetical protein